MILAQIGMCQHEIAQTLRIAQPRTMAQHQPGVRAQHGDMVGGRLGVRGSDADIDQGDPATIGAFQVKGRHLRAVGRLGHGFAGARDHIAGADEFGIARGGVIQRLLRVRGEFIDIELVVGEQDVILKMLGRGGRVMRHPLERIIHPLRGKGGQRADAVFIAQQMPVDDFIIGVGKVRHIKNVAQVEIDIVVVRTDHRVVRKGEMNRDRCRRGPDNDGHAVGLDQQGDLLAQIVFEQVGPRDGGCIGAGFRHMAKGKPAVHMGKAGRGDADFRVKGAIARGRGLPRQNLLEAFHQIAGGLFVQFLKARHGCGGIKGFECRQSGGLFKRQGCYIAPHSSTSSNRSTTLNRVTSTSPLSEIRNSGITTSASRLCCI